MTTPDNNTPKARAEACHNRLVDRMNDAIDLLIRCRPYVGQYDTVLRQQIDKLLAGAS